ncbi:hypothetical protein [Gorillibacterium sp. CAU 1737]|uniref:hypothetical protein n=1 Tax=Gorillibacterium sp. CAU 1737 TaxID=3140362 RepID=UPI00325FE7E7
MGKVVRLVATVAVITALWFGILFGYRYGDGSFDWLVAFLWWVGGIAASLLLLAFSTAIDCLESISVRLARLERSLVPGPPPPVSGNTRAKLDQLDGYTMGGPQ